MKARLFLLAFLIVLPFTGRAQDDDIYFTPSKSEKLSTKTHRIQPVYTPVEDEDEDYEYYTGDLRDIDEYNRRPYIAGNEDRQAVVLDTLGMKWVLSRTDQGDYVWIPAEDYERIQEQADEYFDDMEDFDGFDDDDYNCTSRLVRFHGYVSPYHYGWYAPWYYDYYWGWDPWYSWYWRPWHWGYSWGLGWYGWGGWYGWHHGWHGGWHGGWAYGGRRGSAFGHTRGGALAYGRGRYSGSNLARGNNRVSTGGNRTTLGDRMSARRNSTSSSTRGSGIGSRVGGTSGTSGRGSVSGSSRGGFSGGGIGGGSFGGSRGGFSGGGARGGGGGGRR